MERRYISQAGPSVRVKLIHVKRLEADTILTESEVDDFPGLRNALLECRVKSSVDSYQAEFERLNPTPTILELEAEVAYKLAELLRRKTGKSLYESAMTLETPYGSYVMAVEHHCG
ncbi:MAG: hypothetical protein QXI97_01620 [Nitrososphaerota archaeon]